EGSRAGQPLALARVADRGSDVDARRRGGRVERRSGASPADHPRNGRQQREGPRIPRRSAGGGSGRSLRRGVGDPRYGAKYVARGGRPEPKLERDSRRADRLLSCSVLGQGGSLAVGSSPGRDDGVSPRRRWTGGTGRVY